MGLFVFPRISMQKTKNGRREEICKWGCLWIVEIKRSMNIMVRFKRLGMYNYDSYKINRSKWKEKIFN